MASISFDVRYPDGFVGSVEQEGNAKHLLQFLASFINNSTDGRIENVKVS